MPARLQAVHDVFMDQFGRHFAIRKVGPGKMDPAFQHPLIHVYLLKRRKQPPEAAEPGKGAPGQAAPADAAESAAGAQQEAAAAACGPAARPEQGLVSSTGGARGEADGCAATAQSGEGEGPGGGAAQVGPCRQQHSEQQFETRREASMLARTLKDIKL